MGVAIMVVVGFCVLAVLHKLYIHFVFLRPAKKCLTFLRSPEKWEYRKKGPYEHDPDTNPLIRFSYLIYYLNLGEPYNTDVVITKTSPKRIKSSKEELKSIEKKAYFWAASLCVTFLRKGTENVDLDLLKYYLERAEAKITDLGVTEEELLGLHKRQQIRCFEYYWKKLSDTADPLFFIAAQRQLEEAGLTFDDVGLSEKDVFTAMAQIGSVLK